MRIVIAEDEAIIRMDLREMLQEHGCEVVGEARSGAEALEAVRRMRPDCVFMDIQMNGRDGLDAARAVCEEGLAAVVVLTAFSQESFVKEAAEAGVMAYVTKPFSETDIMPALHVACSRFEQTRALAAEVSDLQERLETRKLVERAKGILMRDGLDEAEAYLRLQRSAMSSRTPLKEIAQAVVTADALRA
ncbi:response regulator [Gordonibacter sp. 28C]|uniref:ANTAR domain-containing response regulator n=1 Tax=Gordonibacter sp. 28C TaxID=2078569 RepID=UPI000DF82BCF|nr:response regulator [Gordonibacter sp. 28C]RDB61825.1 response regulator [Gordonibacter sp. 28C]